MTIDSAPEGLSSSQAEIQLEPGSSPTLPPLCENEIHETPNSSRTVDNGREDVAPTPIAVVGARQTTPPLPGTDTLEPTHPISTDDVSNEPAMSPREKAKNKSGSVAGKVHGNQTTAVEFPMGLVATPLTVITAPQTNVPSRVSVMDVDPLTVPAPIEQYFIHLAGVLQGRQESELLLDWLTLECEEEAKVSDNYIFGFTENSINRSNRQLGSINYPPLRGRASFLRGCAVNRTRAILYPNLLSRTSRRS